MANNTFTYCSDEVNKQITISYNCSSQSTSSLPVVCFTFESLPQEVSIKSEDELPDDINNRVKNTTNYSKDYWTDCNPYYLLFDGKLAGYVLDDSWSTHNNGTFPFISTERIFNDKANDDMTLGEWKRLFVPHTTFKVLN